MDKKNEPSSAVRDRVIRAALDQHWIASDANDFETEHLVYQEDVVLEYRSQASDSAVDAIYRTSAPVSQARSGLLSNESLAG
jgi:hypothetical protein